MIPEIGHFALIIALGISLVQFVVPLVGAHKGIAPLMAVARPAAQGAFVFVAISFAALTYAFVTDDFSVYAAAQYSNTHLPLLYKISGVWGGHEGSLLLWILMLTFWGLAVSVYSRRLPDEMAARVLGVLGFVAVGFLLFILLTSNPFDRLLPPPPDGRDLNPLLQDPGLAIHPPLLYMGYVGFSVAFAFAIAALLSGRLDATWARWSRPWTTVAWVFLTLGIAVGSWWAYYELGWGGWWFWDPVENASFMPWLVGTALIHSLAVTEKRGTFKNWTVLLAIMTFSLCLLGTFLVRSGVLTSVHAFATDPERGTFILIFLVIVVGFSLLLYAWRAPKVGVGGKFDLVSRESFLLANNVLLVVAAGAVLIGTLYPLVMDALGMGKISVGPPYFDSVFVPLMAPAIFLMGIGPIVRWKKAELPDLVTRLKWAAGVSVVSAVLIPVLAGRWSFMIALGVALSVWVVATIAESLIRRIRQRQKAGVGGAGGSLSYYGMQLAHFGVAVFIFGVTMVSAYEEERDVRMDIGDTVEVGGYQFTFEGVVGGRGPNYDYQRGTIRVSRDGHPVTVLHPEKRSYWAQREMPMTEASIDTGFVRDVYVSLGEPIGGGAWSVRVYYKPFVNWIWGGCFLMALGGILAVSDRRYRIAVKEKRAAEARTVAAAREGVTAS